MSNNSCNSCGDSNSQQCGGGQDEKQQKVQQNLQRIKNKIVVLSGKGGVGKSSVSTNIAVGLANEGYKVGLMDVDVHGPSIPRLLNLAEAHPTASDQALDPIQWSQNLSVMSIGFMLPSKNDSVIWRGPIKMGLIQQFIGEVNWGDLDYLIVDCPPGTGDEPISVMQLIGTDALATIVTTPQGLAVDDVRRSINFCNHTGNAILGIIENMSGFVCPHCNQEVDVFNTGGGERLAQETGVSFLGRVPLDPQIVQAGDAGVTLLTTDPENKSSKAIHSVVQNIRDLVGKTKPGTDSTSSEKNDNPGNQNGKTKVAIPVEQGQLCMHFGHCEQFALLDIDEAEKNIEKVEYLNPPPHEPGVLPKWISEQGADLIIAGGIGMKAQNHFQEYGVQVITGAQTATPEDIAKQYLEGSLLVGENACNH